MENNVKETSAKFDAHVVMMPQPAQGHIKPMLNLAELLCLANIQVTFVMTAYHHGRLLQSTDSDTRFGRYTGFRFKVMPDTPFPEKWTEYDHLQLLNEIVKGLAVTAKPLLEDLFCDHCVVDMTTSPDDESWSRGVTCMVVDTYYDFVHDIANAAGVPVLSFCAISACYLWSLFCVPGLIDAKQLPFSDEDMDKLIDRNAPGMDTFLRYRDLPSFCRIKNDGSCLRLQQTCAAEAKRTKAACGLILNTFEDLEGPVMSHLRSQCSTVYSIGPLHTLLKHRLTQESATLSNPSGSLREVDQSCLPWLDQKPPKSVVYVAFGSLAGFTQDQIFEIWEGLLKSKKYFLWAIIPYLLTSNKERSKALLDASKERGHVVSWAPQEAVLAHPSVGGFFTHNGWNSTIESIVDGVPMICCPYFADQQINSRFVGAVWKIGLDMKDIYDRNVVAQMVNDLLDEKTDEVQKSMATMSDAAKRSVTEGGSSYCNLERLIQDIKMMSVKKEKFSAILKDTKEEELKD